MDGYDIYNNVSETVPIATFNYKGDHENGLRNGRGIQKWEREYTQIYRGQFLNDNLHGTGDYSINIDNEKDSYSGQIYLNDFEGYGQISYANGTIFEGLFRSNQRFGPGIFTDTNGTQNVGLWYGKSLIRLSCVVKSEWVPRLGKSASSQAKLLKHRKLVPICPMVEDNAKIILKKLGANENVLNRSDELYNIHINNPRSTFFKKKLYDEAFFKIQDCVIEVTLTDEELLMLNSQKSEEIQNEIVLEEFPTLIKEVKEYPQYEQLTENMEDDTEEVKEFDGDTSTRVAYSILNDDDYDDESVDTYAAFQIEVIDPCEAPNHLEELQKRYMGELDKINERLEELEEQEKSVSEQLTMLTVCLLEQSGLGSEDAEEAMKRENIERDLQWNYHEKIKEQFQLSNEKALIVARKNHLLKQLQTEQEPIGNVKPPTKRIFITDLLAWNNGKLSMSLLKHTFLHRNSESNVCFNVQKLLSGARSEFRKPGVYEEDCVSFLTDCSNGREINASALLIKHDINPNICDARGNTGMMFAAARDKIHIVRILMKYGAKLDAVNDEGLTPLTICIARYLAIMFKVSDWESAFLSKISVNQEEELEVREWRPHASMVSITSQPLKQEVIDEAPAEPSNTDIIKERLKSLAGSLLFKRASLCRSHGLVRSKIFSESLDDVRFKSNSSLSDVQQTLQALQLQVEIQDFQQPYLTKIGSKPQDYLLNTDCFKPPPEKKPKEKKGKKKDKKKSSKSSKKTKSSKKSKSSKASKKSDKKKGTTIEIDKVECIEVKPSELILDNRLGIIYNTITALLKAGADPNYGEVPCPPLILAMFSKDSDLIKDLLDYSADPNVSTTDDHLTPLHILASLKPSGELLEIAELLIQYSADPNCKTSPTHWIEQKEELVNKELDVGDEGKSPLHIISLRYDFKLDERDVLSNLALLLIKNGGRVNDFYFGHTPLSLAVLRGNVNLTKALLSEKKVDPNQILGLEMGVPLTVLILKRYKTKIPADYQVIYDLLLEHGANPFNEIPNYGNALEFMETEHKEPPKKEKKGKAGKKGKSKSSKSTKTSKSSKKGKKGKKKKQDPQEEVKQYLIVCARKTLLQRVQLKALNYLYNFIIENACDDQISEKLGKLVSSDVIEKYLQLLIHTGKIKSRNYNKGACLELFNYIKSFERPKSSKKKKKKKTEEPSILELSVEDVVEKMEFNRLPKAQRRLKMLLPELDQVEDKYQVCFHCGQKLNKQLILCPECNLVYFCSQECNKLNNKQKNQHKCATLFYNNEKKNYEECYKRGEMYNPKNNLRDKLFSIGEIRKQREEDKSTQHVVSTFTTGSKVKKLKIISSGLASTQGKFFVVATEKEATIGPTDFSSILGKAHWPKRDHIVSYQDKKWHTTSRTELVGVSGEFNFPAILKEEGRKKSKKLSIVSESSTLYSAQKRRTSKVSESATVDSQQTTVTKDSKVSDNSTVGYSLSSAETHSQQKIGLHRQQSKSHRSSLHLRKGDSKSSIHLRKGDSRSSTRLRKGDSRSSNRLRKSDSRHKTIKSKGARIPDRGKSSDSGDSLDLNTMGQASIVNMTRAFSGGFCLIPSSLKIKKKLKVVKPKKPKKIKKMLSFDSAQFNPKLPRPISLPNKYQYFMQQLSDLFPEFNLEMLLLPYACFSDGQLYYRFLGKNPIFAGTYSNM